MRGSATLDLNNASISLGTLDNSGTLEAVTGSNTIACGTLVNTNQITVDCWRQPDADQRDRQQQRHHRRFRHAHPQPRLAQQLRHHRCRGSATLDLNNASISLGTLDNSGTLEAVTGSTTISSGTLVSTDQITVDSSRQPDADQRDRRSSGTIDDSGTLTLNLGSLSNSGTIEVDGSGSLDLNNASISLGTLDNSGTLEAVTGSTTISSGTLVSTDQITVDSSASLTLTSETAQRHHRRFRHAHPQPRLAQQLRHHRGRGSASLDLNNASISLGTLDNSGTLEAVTGSNTIACGTLVSTNQITVDSSASLTLTSETAAQRHHRRFRHAHPQPRLAQQLRHHRGRRQRLARSQ